MSCKTEDIPDFVKRFNETMEAPVQKTEWRADFLHPFSVSHKLQLMSEKDTLFGGYNSLFKYMKGGVQSLGYIVWKIQYEFDPEFKENPEDEVKGCHKFQLVCHDKRKDNLL